ncbi:hypothetical protein GCM10008967_37030 [Bacillus carboniphilus]|uniref:histidine kinase n=1 Tax=Bacillus carboniphilus TaxID=86663 RepID=A0ABP3GDX5_9BACI
MIASISHDLKTPITSIKGYVEGIQDGVADTPEKMERYIQTIHTKANELDHLIEELFLFSKLDVSAVPFHFEKVDLRTFVQFYIDELKDELERAEVEVQIQDDGGDFYTKADREHLRRVFANVIQNAVNHLDKDEKRISIGLVRKSEYVMVSIKDNGKGISEDALPYIFDRFYRADQSRQASTGGSGLGLAIVKRIMEEHGGETWAKSRLGEGTTIYLKFKPYEEKMG